MIRARSSQHTDFYVNTSQIVLGFEREQKDTRFPVICPVLVQWRSYTEQKARKTSASDCLEKQHVMATLRFYFLLQLCVLAVSQKTALDSPMNLHFYRQIRNWLMQNFGTCSITVQRILHTVIFLYVERDKRVILGWKKNFLGMKL